MERQRDAEHGIAIAEQLWRELERALIARIEDFLRAMGGKELFIDLLLFHRHLRWAWS